MHTLHDPDDDEFDIMRYRIVRYSYADCVYSENAAYQYKIIKTLTGYTDIIGQSIGYSEDFYISETGNFHKSLPELILGNLLHFSELNFNIAEIYSGIFDGFCCKKTSFALEDEGVTISITSEKTQAGLSSIVVDCNYDCGVQFNRESRAPRRYVIPKDIQIDVGMIASSFCTHLALCSVHVDLKLFDHEKFTHTWQDVLPLNTHIEMRKLGLVHEVVNESC